MEAHLLPKLRCHFAEFLNQGSLKRLGILSPPTCVGFRYDHLRISFRGFSWQHGISQFIPLARILITSRHLYKIADFPATPAYLLEPPVPSDG